MAHIVVAKRIPPELADFTAREINWLWRDFENVTGLSVPLRNEFQPQEKLKYMADKISSQPAAGYLITKILDEKHLFLISERYFDWINEGDHRLINWLYLSSCTWYTDYKPTILEPKPDRRFDMGLPPPRLHAIPVNVKVKRQEIILSVDIQKDTADTKITHLHQLENEWASRRTPDSEIKWLDEKNNDQMNWAWDYLVKYRKNSVAPHLAKNMGNLYRAIIASFDYFYMSSSADRSLFIIQMKKTWSQKKYRASEKAKRARSFPMTEEVFQMLNDCAKQHGKKPFEILETLIRQEYQLKAKR